MESTQEPNDNEQPNDGFDSDALEDDDGGSNDGVSNHMCFES
jgi:hypothetical protein